MIDRLIVITTAICRCQIHEKCFNNILPIFKNVTCPIYWFINLDRPEYCPDDISQTENNVRTIFSHFGNKFQLDITKTNRPCFFEAVRTLLLKSYPFLSNDCGLLWMEDDWMLRDNHSNFDLRYYIDQYLIPNSVLSLSYNALGSFPPFMMGWKIAKEFYEEFFRGKHFNKRFTTFDPEKESRRALRNLSLSKGIKYYLCLTNGELNTLIKGSPINVNFPYTEPYLIIPDSKILILSNQINNNSNTNNCTVHDNKVDRDKFIDTYQNYRRNINNDIIIFTRFGLNIQSGGFFVDIGREWKRKNNK